MTAVPRSLGLAFASLPVIGLVVGSTSADEPVGSSVRYNREIVRIFDRKCVPCHAPGAPAMPLATYHDVLPWTRAIREEILERRMPPWSAAHGVQPLANDISLSTREIAIIVSWADGGAPRGGPADLPAAKPRPQWPAGEPTLKLTAPPQTVAADGRLHVRRVTLRTRLPSERWLRAFDFVPGDRRGARSAFLFLDVPGSGREQWLGAWTPWHAMTAPPGVAYKLPPGAVLRLEVHYLAWGSSEAVIDRSEVGLYLDSTRPASLGQDLTIAAVPANESGTQRKLRGEATIAADLAVWAFRPQLASGDDPVGGSIEVAATRPDGAIEPLLWVKDYQPDWQTPYVLREPVWLPRGSRLMVTAYPASPAGSRVTAGVSIGLYSSAPAGLKATATPVIAPRAQRPPRR